MQDIQLPSQSAWGLAHIAGVQWGLYNALGLFLHLNEPDLLDRGWQSGRWATALMLDAGYLWPYDARGQHIGHDEYRIEMWLAWEECTPGSTTG